MSSDIYNYGLVRSLGELEQFASRLLAAGDVVSIDCETGYHGLPHDDYAKRPETAFIVGFSFTNRTDWARYVPLGHDMYAGNLDPFAVAPLLWRWWRQSRLIAHNALFEMRHLAKFFRVHLSDDSDVQERDGYLDMFSDTMVELYDLAELQSVALKYATKQNFGHQMVELVDLFPGLPKNQQKTLRFNTLEVTPEVVDYACEDALWALRHHEENYDKVRNRLLYKVDMGVLPVLAEMADYGVKYDWPFLAHGERQAEAFQTKLNAEIQADLSAMVGEMVTVNLGSPAQISDVLYGKLKMKTTRTTKGSRNKPKAEKKMSTDRIALAALAKQYPVVKRITEWKELRKLITSYLAIFEKKYGFAEDGMVHGNLLPCAVITGRFAGADPNNQNLPKKYHYELNSGEEFTLNFRDVVVAPAEHYQMGFDLGQAELRAVAGEAQIQTLLSAFENDEDVHSKIASLMLNIPLEQVGEKERNTGKTLNFALVYEMKPEGLADRLGGIPLEESMILFGKYHALIPELRTWADKQVRFGLANGYVVSKFGRKLPIWEFYATERWVREKGERSCVNYPIQGAATGDYMRIVMIRCRKAIREAGLQDKIHMVLNIHDALEFYVHRSVTPQQVYDLLQPAVVFPVPGWPKMVADWHIGRKWGSLKSLGVDEDGTLYVKGDREDPGPPLSPETDDGDGSDAAFLDVDVDALRALARQEMSTTDAPPAEEVSAEPDRGPVYFSPIKAQETGSGWAETLDELATDGPAHRLVVEVSDMPDEETFARFTELAERSPGVNTVLLRTPEGDVELWDLLTGLTPSAQPRISLALGGARAYYDQEDGVDDAEMVRGLTL